MIRLDQKTHTYYWSGVRVPGVTEILTRTGIARYPETERLADARLRGTRFHLAVELHEKGTLDPDSLKHEELVRQNIRERLDAYLRFRDDHIAKVLRYEMIVGHHVFRYGGKLDQLSVTRDGRLVVWDWKSGKLPWWVELQTGAYLEAILSDKSLELESDQVWHGAVSFYADGTYSEPRISQDRKEFAMFRQALNIVNYCDRRAA